MKATPFPSGILIRLNRPKLTQGTGPHVPHGSRGKALGKRTRGASLEVPSQGLAQEGRHLGLDFRIRPGPPGLRPRPRLLRQEPRRRLPRRPPLLHALKPLPHAPLRPAARGPRVLAQPPPLLQPRPDEPHKLPKLRPRAHPALLNGPVHRRPQGRQDHRPPLGGDGGPLPQVLPHPRQGPGHRPLAQGCRGRPPARRAFFASLWGG